MSSELVCHVRELRARLSSVSELRARLPHVHELRARLPNENGAPGGAPSAIIPDIFSRSRKPGLLWRGGS